MLGYVLYIPKIFHLTLQFNTQSAINHLLWKIYWVDHTVIMAVASRTPAQRQLY